MEFESSDLLEGWGGDPRCWGEARRLSPLDLAGWGKGGRGEHSSEGRSRSSARASRPDASPSRGPPAPYPRPCCSGAPRISSAAGMSLRGPAIPQPSGRALISVLCTPPRSSRSRAGPLRPAAPWASPGPGTLRKGFKPPVGSALQDHFAGSDSELLT
ncbi:hypothetical protein NDU88_004672 [Pleurodeles waltl]|uniref:Uncharacterized protein n=1 Tax=Pleurodeles waltl TaxID=8319 RepID=A0AAV7LKM2_PLEWA|nr:hypothetical protein NDU88_004672 [Pleurodeles waltl]